MPNTAAPAIAAEGIDGASPVEALRCGNYLCWVSRVPRHEFADTISDRMQDLEWLATTGLRHQRAVAEISAQLTALPARFGTVFLSEESLAQHVTGRSAAFKKAFGRVADADEWGIKIFAEPKRVVRPATKAASGSDYLKRKAELLQPRKGRTRPRSPELRLGDNEAGGRSEPGREGQRGSARAGMARIVSHPPRRPPQARRRAEDIRCRVEGRAPDRLQRPMAAVFICGGACPLSPKPSRR